MICTRCSCNCCCCGCCCCCICCCWCQGQWMRRRRSMYWKIAKKNLSYTKTNTLRLHFVADCCWLPSPVTRFPTPTGLPAHLAAPAAAVVVCAWGRQNNFTLLTHFMFIKSADRADWIEPNWAELNWTWLDCPALDPGLNRTLSASPAPLHSSSLPKVNPNLCMLHLIKHLCSMTACCCMCSVWCVVCELLCVCLCVCMKSFHMIYSPVQWSSQRRWSVPSGCSPAACCKQIWWPEN